MTSNTRVRFAPSPTGALHIGGAHPPLFNGLGARHIGGSFILRIEDTDLARSTEEHERTILQGLSWLGLDWDEGPDVGGSHGPYRQSERREIYLRHAHDLVRSGQAYCEGEAVIFSVPKGRTVAFDDLVYGHIEMESDTLKDVVLIKSDGFPTYNYAVVVDDHLMEITCVVRGEDHISNTPKQLLLYQALGWETPLFAPLPMILGPDGAKLSKRHGAVNVLGYREDGFLPQALLNYLVRLGWSYGDQEIFSMAEMISLFSADDVNHSASRFDVEKLRWLNQHYLKTLDPAAVAPELRWHLARAGLDADTGPKAEDIIVALRERVHTLNEMADKARVWFGPLAGYDDAAVAKHLTAAARAPLQAAQEALAALQGWSAASVHDALNAAAQGLGVGLGKVAQPLRVAITGTQVSPSIDHTVYLAGQAEALRRIDAALGKLPA